MSSSPQVSGISNLSFRVMHKPIGERHKPIDHVTQASPVRKRYDWEYATLCISISVSVSNCPHFLDSLIGCVDGVRSHGLHRFKTKSRHHLLIVLRIHNLLFRDVYLENSGEVLPKFCLRSVQSMRTNPSYASSRVGLGPILTYQNWQTWCRCKDDLLYYITH